MMIHTFEPQPTTSFNPVPPVESLQVARQNTPCVSGRMNPVPNSPRKNHALPVQKSWNGVNDPDSLQVLCPKATGVSPWFGVHGQDKL